MAVIHVFVIAFIFNANIIFGSETKNYLRSNPPRSLFDLLQNNNVDIKRIDSHEAEDLVKSIVKQNRINNDRPKIIPLNGIIPPDYELARDKINGGVIKKLLTEDLLADLLSDNSKIDGLTPPDYQLVRGFSKNNDKRIPPDYELVKNREIPPDYEFVRHGVLKGIIPPDYELARHGKLQRLILPDYELIKNRDIPPDYEIVRHGKSQGLIPPDYELIKNRDIPPDYEIVRHGKSQGLIPPDYELLKNRDIPPDYELVRHGKLRFIPPDYELTKNRDIPPDYELVRHGKLQRLIPPDYELTKNRDIPPDYELVRHGKLQRLIPPDYELTKNRDISPDYELLRDGNLEGLIPPDYELTKNMAMSPNCELLRDKKYKSLYSCKLATDEKNEDQDIDEIPRIHLEDNLGNDFSEFRSVVKRLVQSNLESPSTEYDKKNNAYFNPLIRLPNINTLDDVSNEDEFIFVRSPNEEDLLEKFGLLSQQYLHKKTTYPHIYKPLTPKEEKRAINLVKHIQHLATQIDSPILKGLALERILDVLRKVEDLRQGEAGENLGEKNAEESVKTLNPQPLSAYVPFFNYWTYQKTIIDDDCPEDSVKIGNVCSRTPPHRAGSHKE